MKQHYLWLFWTKRRLSLAIALIILGVCYAIVLNKGALSPEAKKAASAIKQEAVRRGWKQFQIVDLHFKDGVWYAIVTHNTYIPGTEVPGADVSVSVRNGEVVEWSRGL